MGVQTSAHWTVPDDRALIRRALDLSAEVSDLIFVTGGLGPTTDDFTRDMIADWAGFPLQWHEASWTHLCERLESRGIAVHEIQRQQCFYPEGAEVLSNSQGTANGFRLRAQGKMLVVLPGPPREIEALWRDHLQVWLPSQFPNLDAWITRSWDTIGSGESSVAEIVEAALAGCEFEKGYRVHLPYVEVKLSYPRSRLAEGEKWVAKLTESLAPQTVLRDGDDSSRLLAQGIMALPLTNAQSLDRPRVILVDEISGSYFWSRLSPHFTPLWREHAVVWSNEALDAREQDLVLRLARNGAGDARASISYKGHRRATEFSSPYQSALLQDREKQYFAELAALFWIRELAAICHPSLTAHFPY